MKESPKSKNKLGRRHFLGGAAGAAAGVVAAGVEVAGAAQAERASSAPPAAVAVNVPPPTAAQIQRDAGEAVPSREVRASVRPGSDLMVQALRDLGVEFIAANPGSSFEGLQESVINYGTPPNVRPEFITALHEMSAVDMAHGYGKAEVRPMVALLHGTLGLQNAAMAIYQAYYDRTPVLLIAGRDDGFIQAHTADDMAAMVRSYTKWDAHPQTISESLEAIQQAYNLAMTPPCAPTLVVLDTELQKEEAGNMAVPAPPPIRTTTIDRAEARAIAARLVSAGNPRIEVGRLRTPVGVQRAVDLAELVGASTGTDATGGPMSFPQRHPLCGPGADDAYDYVLGIEAPGADASIQSPHVRTIEGRDPLGIGFGENRPNGGNRPGAQGAPGGANDMVADAEDSLPMIIEEVRSAMTSGQRDAAGRRQARHGSANQLARVQAVRQALASRRLGWNSSPISTARVYAELWPLIMNEDWCLASPSSFSGAHHRELWSHDRPYSFLGGQGAAGMGYGLGASVGAALAARERNRIVINIQCDGDFNYAPGALWTAAHHRLPMLTIMHNNRAWHQELMFVEYMTGVRGRGTDRGHIGTTLRDPHIDYAKLAEGYGMAGEGPITDPRRLAAAFARGVERVKQGEPYLIDVITQPR